MFLILNVSKILLSIKLKLSSKTSDWSQLQDYRRGLFQNQVHPNEEPSAAHCEAGDFIQSKSLFCNKSSKLYVVQSINDLNIFILLRH